MTPRAGGNGSIVRRHPVVVAVAVLVVLFVLVDRVAAYAADRIVATKVQRAEHLTARPDVTVDGFPLLTQVVSERYEEVDIRVDGLHRGGVTASSVDVHLYGLRVGVGELVSGDVRRVPVDRADGTVLFSYRDLDRMLAARGITVAYDHPGAVTVRGGLSVAGRHIDAVATADVRVTDGDLVVAPQHVDVAGGSLLGSAISELARGRLSVRLPLPDLPFGIRVDGVDVRQQGVVAHAASNGMVIDVG